MAQSVASVIIAKAISDKYWKKETEQQYNNQLVQNDVKLLGSYSFEQRTITEIRSWDFAFRRVVINGTSLNTSLQADSMNGQQQKR